jgi:hypothetical protein
VESVSAVKQLGLANLSEDEKNARAAAAVTQYGQGTRSYNRSAEKREMDRQREETTAKYHAGELKIHDCSSAFLLCYCRSFEHGHSPELHRRLREECDWSLPSERRNIYYDERVR